MVFFLIIKKLFSVSGVDLHLIAAIITVVCIIYTIIGGLRAVVATDAWQVVVMFFSVLAVAILGTIYQGGFGSIFKTLSDGGRLNMFE